mmetsp:Transcript_66261/g.115589  ORF Transcript_66261/g.115589 Transcript_66261/m.115589 type:complete len:442 (-) Transcript_66261:43-1368(-)
MANKLTIAVPDLTENVAAALRNLKGCADIDCPHQLARLLKMLDPTWTDEMTEKLVASSANIADDADDLVKWIWTPTSPQNRAVSLTGLEAWDDDVKMRAGRHVDDLIAARENWRDIRPERYVKMDLDHDGSVRTEASTGHFLQRIKVYAGVNMSEQAHIWRSKTFDALAAQCKARPIFLPGEADGSITFGSIFDMIKEHGCCVYIYGGVLRDVIMKGLHVADDIDVLFTCDVHDLCAWCEERGWKLGTHYNLKKDEKTGEYRYDYISIGKGKEKFSGHTLDANCAGEFTFNCLLYDIKRALFIDSTGWGVRDAVHKKLNIPYDGGRLQEWDHWSEMCDRLPGMISLRFFNFRSRGYGAKADVVAHNVKWLKDKGATSGDAVRVFLKRKVLGSMDDKAKKKLEIFRTAVGTDFDSALGEGAGEAWLKEYLDPIAESMMKDWK